MAAAKKTASLKRTEPGTASTSVAPKVGTNIISLEAQMAADLATISERTAPASGDKIRITQDKKFALPDGRTTPNPIEVVIVDFISANNFYEGAFDPNNITPPACFAIGTNPTTMVPSDNSPDKQADTCAVCPNNAFGSAGNGKACKNTRLLAVLPPDAKEGDQLMLLSVSPGAIKGFDAYVKNVATQFKRPPIGVVTTVSFDDSVTYASLRFGDPKPTPGALLQLAATYREAARERLLTEPDVSGYAKPAARAPARKVARR